MKADSSILILLLIGAISAAIGTGESLLVWQSVYSLSVGVMAGWILRRIANANHD